jgi:hypothetical protein
VRTISQITKSGNATIPQKRKPKLLDQIPDDIQDRIMQMTDEGLSRRQISQRLIDEGVPSPDMAVPWGENAITLVQKKFKG